MHSLLFYEDKYYALILQKKFSLKFIRDFIKSFSEIFTNEDHLFSQGTGENIDDSLHNYASINLTLDVDPLYSRVLL